MSKFSEKVAALRAEKQASDKAAAVIAVKKARAFIKRLRACGKHKEADKLEAALKEDIDRIFKS